MKGQITLVTGGARSGKSAFAEKLCAERGEKIGYIATAAALDEGMVERIKRHKERRPDSWTTFEKQQMLHDLMNKDSMRDYDVFLLDCLTVLTTNIMLSDYEIDWDTIPRETVNYIEEQVLTQIEALIDSVMKHGHKVIVVTNEVGLGIVPENRLARIYRDIAGKANEIVAKHAGEVYFVVSGIPMKIKG